MNVLENGFYTLQEISKATGVPRGNQFARDMRRWLDREGYTYEWVNRQGVTILSHHLSPLDELKKLLMERFDMDTQVNALDFAWFIVALTTLSGFAAMPYATKEREITKLCGHNIDDSTLRRWAGKLYESGNAHHSDKGALWHTFIDENGRKKQEQADPLGAEYKEYCRLRSATLTQMEEADAENPTPQTKTAFGRMISQLYPDYGYYYWCPEIVLNALGDDIEDIIRLVDEITTRSD